MLHEFVLNVLSFFAELGYFGIALGLMIEIIPSEIVLGYAGYLVSRGDVSFWGAVVAGVIGGVIAQLFLYWLGYYGGRPILNKYGKYLLIKEHHLDLAERWFEKYGVGVVFSARFIPIVRHAISIPAGIAKMSVWKFLIYTIIAIIPWSIFFVYLGKQLRDKWDQIDDVASQYTQPLTIAVIVLVVLYVSFKIWKGRRK